MLFRSLNKVAWNLRYDSPMQVELRHTPPEQPHIWEDPRFVGRETRPIIHWGIEGAMRAGPVAAPGRYSVRVTAGGKSQAQKFTVLLDKDVKQPVADLAANTKAQVRVRDNINATVEMINRLEVMRRQAQDAAGADTTKPEAKAALRKLDQQIKDVELLMLSNSDLMSDDKYYVETYKIYLQLVWLNGDIGTGGGDVAGGADHRPTDAALQLTSDIEKDIKNAKARVADLDKIVAEFNKQWAGKLRPIGVPKAAM